MSPVLRMFLAILAFGFAAYIATRLRISVGEKGSPEYFSNPIYLAMAKSKAARSFINRVLLKMIWGWIACALILSLSIKVIEVIVIGCLFLGIILSAVTYRQVEKFKPIETDPDDEKRKILDYFVQEDYQRAENKEEIQRLWSKAENTYRAKAHKEALKKGNEQLRHSNRKIFIGVLIASAMVPLVYLLAKWAGSLATTGHVIVIVVMIVINLISYAIVTSRW